MARAPIVIRQLPSRPRRKLRLVMMDFAALIIAAAAAWVIAKVLNGR